MKLSRGRLSFPKSSRLLCRVDFNRVFEHAEKSADHCFTVLARCNNLGKPRIGLAIAKKTVKNANQRNRMKRLIRESFRLNQSELGGIDFVVLARKGVEKRENPELHASLAKHWTRLVKKCAVS